MQSYFEHIASYLDQLMHTDEIYTAWFEGEDTDFVRFNRAAVRQSGSVSQKYLKIDLISNHKTHTSAEISLSGHLDLDRPLLTELIANLRQKLRILPEDPYLLYNTEPVFSQNTAPNQLPDIKDILDCILHAARGLDFVGFYAGGGIYRGFASSLGQRNWFEKFSFNLNWSLYSSGDKAVKSAYAGFEWHPQIFQSKMEQTIHQLDIMKRPAKTIAPASYRVYLAPAAVQALFELLNWNSFSHKSHRSHQTALLKMAKEDARLHPDIYLCENTAAGAGPDFQSAGFLKPQRIDLISNGALHHTLISPRSAKEYGQTTNGANDEETPEALELEAGSLPQNDILSKLHTGIYINNLWYLNFSDRPAGRITGMTRFACLWVENGEIYAPINVMRFDDSIYRILGSHLEDITNTREFILSPNTYFKRSTNSFHLPGLLLEQLIFTL
jgi:predicted Zn-dependent protease